MAFRVFVLTASDAGSRGEREDKSGPCIEEMVTAAGYEVTGRALLPDDREALAEKMREVCDKDLADLLLTTGGTGFSPRDCMPEATADVTERAVPGIPEAMRYLSLRHPQGDAHRQSPRQPQGREGVPRVHSPGAGARSGNSQRHRA